MTPLSHVLGGADPLSHDEVEDGEDVDEEEDGAGDGQGEDRRTGGTGFEQGHVCSLVGVGVWWG